MTKKKSVYLVAIGGTGMSALAGMLKESGFDVSGSDKGLYYPTSELLRELSVPVKIGYSSDNVPSNIEFAVIGNAVSKNNPEAVEIERRGIKQISFPQALWEYFIKGKKSVVSAGTHGKTTTSSAIAYLFSRLGEDIGFMIGGVPKDFGKNYKLGKSSFFVVEGDEYDSAYFDKGPKFLHYMPDYLLLNDVEFDHADIYRNLEQILGNFSKLVDLVDEKKGGISAFGDSKNVRELIKDAKTPTIRYGFLDKNDWIIEKVDEEKGEVFVTAKDLGRFSFKTRLIGRHNYANLTGVIALFYLMGFDVERCAKEIEGFRGVKRRQELVGCVNHIEIYDDFAHHPTAVRKTLEGFRARFPKRRIIAVFEPRSNSSRRKIFEKEYSESFDDADIVILSEPYNKNLLPDKERFSSAEVIERIKSRGREAYFIENVDSIIMKLVSILKEGDIVVGMSNGDFGNFHKKLVKKIIQIYQYDS